MPLYVFTLAGMVGIWPYLFSILLASLIYLIEIFGIVTYLSPMTGVSCYCICSAILLGIADVSGSSGAIMLFLFINFGISMFVLAFRAYVP
jgi:hypothetical protein